MVYFPSKHSCLYNKLNYIRYSNFFFNNVYVHETWAPSTLYLKTEIFPFGQTIRPHVSDKKGYRKSNFLNALLYWKVLKSPPSCGQMVKGDFGKRLHDNICMVNAWDKMPYRHVIFLTLFCLGELKEQSYRTKQYPQHCYETGKLCSTSST